MNNIQEIAEELVNLSVKEVNELAMVLKYDMDMPQVRYEESKYNKVLTPKQYGQSLQNNKKWMNYTRKRF